MNYKSVAESGSRWHNSRPAAPTAKVVFLTERVSPGPNTEDIARPAAVSRQTRVAAKWDICPRTRYWNAAQQIPRTVK